VNEDIIKYGIEYFVFIIFRNYMDDISLAKAEEDLQIELNVLSSKIGDDYIFYNKSINGKLFRPIKKSNTNLKVQPLVSFVGKNNPNFGKKHTESARKIMSEASKNRVSNPNSYVQSKETKLKNRKVYKFKHKDNYFL
jgi:NUMOD3 motif